MVNTQKLKAVIVEKGFTYGEVAKTLGMSRKVWADRMNSKKFNSDEIYKLIKKLDITDPMSIFFADDVT